MELKKKDILILGTFAFFIIYFSVQDVSAITVYPGVIIENNSTNYTSNVKPNFNVTQIATNSTGIFLGQNYFNLTLTTPISLVDANITGFNENKNMTILQTIPRSVFMNLYAKGLLQSVSLNNMFLPYGTNWLYTNNVNQTQIELGSNTNVFLSYFSSGITVSSFTLSGYVLSGSGVMNEPVVTLALPGNANVTTLFLFNTQGTLIASQNFSPPLKIQANTPFAIPSQLQDNSNPTGTVSYFEEAIVQSGSSNALIKSNTISLVFGSFTNGNLNFNQTNTNTVPIYFIRNDLNKTDTRLSVIYPSTFNLKCNLGYTFAFTNQTYGPPLANIPYQGSNVNSSFKFHNVQNEIVNVICTDTITNSTGRYVLTQNNFPFQQQIASFRAGTFGTQGNFGIFDFVSLGVILISMIGFNRKNEAVGAFFSISIIGAAAYFGIVTLPTFIIGAVIVAGLLAYTTTKKQSEVF